MCAGHWIGMVMALNVTTCSWMMADGLKCQPHMHALVKYIER